MSLLLKTDVAAPLAHTAARCLLVATAMTPMGCGEVSRDRSIFKVIVHKVGQKLMLGHRLPGVNGTVICFVTHVVP
eukprot:6187668-Pleurochrysis_carterae.AAC.3